MDLGLKFYSVDTNRFQDRKIRKLFRKNGTEGYCIYEYALNEVYKCGYYCQYDEDLCFDIADDLNVDEKTVSDVIAYCCEIELFSQEMLEHGILTSKSIQERYKLILRKQKRKVVMNKYVLTDEEENQTQCSEESSKSSEDCTENSEDSISLMELDDETSEESDESSEFADEKKRKEKKRNISSPPNACACMCEDWKKDQIELYENDDGWIQQLSEELMIEANDVKTRLRQFKLQIMSEGDDSTDVRELLRHLKAWLRVSKRVYNEKPKNHGNDSNSIATKLASGYAALLQD